jgi:hypothetical protein
MLQPQQEEERHVKQPICCVPSSSWGTVRVNDLRRPASFSPGVLDKAECEKPKSNDRSESGSTPVGCKMIAYTSVSFDIVAR